MTNTNFHRNIADGMAKRKEKWGYLFLLPWLFMFCVFSLYPLIYGIAVSFTDYNLSGMHFNGLENYKKILDNYAFWRSLAGTARYAVIVIPLQTFIPLWVASVLRSHSAGVNTLTKLLIYLPNVTCSVALVIVWKFLFWPSFGVLDQILKRMGITNFYIFDSANTSIPVISLLIVLSNMGQNVVIFCAAINSIPDTYYEAAEMDGAVRTQQFRHITVPILAPVITYVLVTCSIGALQIFVIPQMMTGGGPNYTSSTLLMLIYDTAFGLNQFGYASAMGVLVFIFAGIVAAVQFRLSRSEVVEY